MKDGEVQCVTQGNLTLSEDTRFRAVLCKLLDNTNKSSVNVFQDNSADDRS